MAIREKRVSVNGVGPISFFRHYRLVTRVAVLTIALVALLVANAMPGYSSNYRTPIVLRPAPQSEGFKVTPTLDSDHAVIQIVPAGGGTVTATGADGTKFTLIIPVNSLLSSVRVTMTPVSVVGGLPLSGGLAAAVQLEPDGLRLFNFASLVIEPPQSPSPNQEFSFAWDQAGEDFHLFPMQTPNTTRRENTKGSGPQLDPRGLIFKVQHFSGYGVGSGTDTDHDAQLQRQPSGSEAGFEQRLEAIAGSERKRQLATTQSRTKPESVKTATDDDSPDYVDQLIDELKDRYTNEVRLAMDAALLSEDDTELECAILKALGWQRQVELLVPEDLTGKDAKFFRKAKKAIFKFLQSALKIKADNASKRCSKDHKPQETITLLSIGRQQELLGFDSSKTYKDAADCAHFELEFDSETELRNPAETVHTHVHAIVPIGLRFLNTPGDQIPGAAPIDYLSCQWTLIDSPCSATASTQGSTFRVISFNIDLNPRNIDCKNGSSDGNVNLVSVDIDPGMPLESLKTVCPPPEGTNTLPQVVWIGTFGEFHTDEQDVTGAFVITGWEQGNGSLLARKTYNRSGLFDGFPMTEQTTINLWHRPE